MKSYWSIHNPRTGIRTNIHVTTRPTDFRKRQKSNYDKLDTPDDDLSTSMESQTLTVEFFRERLTSEVSRLRGLCSKWQEAMVDRTLDGVDPDDVRCAVGKASILISGRIKQFSSLIDDCERAEKSGGASDRPVTKVTDLQVRTPMTSLFFFDTLMLWWAQVVLP